MPRARNANTTRSHHRKPVAPDPALDAMVDTLIDDGANPDAVKAAPRPRAQKPGPKKVLSETTRIVGDGAALGVLLVTSQPDQRKNLTMEEAQSIGHPIVRMISRRLPAWLKPFLPKTSLSPEDTADIEEILATLGKWSVRLVTIMVEDFLTARESAQAGRKQQQPASTPVQPVAAAMPHPGASLDDLSESESEVKPAPIVAPSPNGHNPAFDVLNSVDLGIEVG